MARKQSPLLTSIWRDTDFLRLSAGAQRAYMLVLSQPNLSYCGVVPFTPKRWAGYAADTPLRDVRRAVDELVAAGFLVLDVETEEVWVRSFIKHNQVMQQPNIALAARKDAEAVQSQAIRDAIAERFPDLFADPCDKGSGKPSGKGSRKGASRDVLRPNPYPDPDHDPDPGDALNDVPTTIANGSSSSVVETAALVFGYAQAASSVQAIDNPAKYASGVARNVLAEQGERLRAYVAEHPSADAEAVAANVFKLDRWALIGARKAMP